MQLRYACQIPLAALIAAVTLMRVVVPTAPAYAAPIVVNSIAPGSEGPSIVGLAIEDFEDVILKPGFSVTYSQWRNSSNVITAALPLTYSGTLPRTWAPSSDGFPLNPWDGTRAISNGNNSGLGWSFSYASSVEFTFTPARAAVGIGLSNFQTDAAVSFTHHSLYVNGVSQGELEALPGWVSTIFNRNRYLLITGDPIASIRITADTCFDGLVFDKLAFGELATAASSTTWGRIKSLYR